MNNSLVEYERLWLLTNALPQAVLLIDPQGVLLFANQSFADLACIEHSKLIYGLPFPEKNLDLKLSHFVHSSLGAKAPREVEIIIQNGANRRFFLAKSLPLESSKTKELVFLVQFDDITRVKHLEQMRQDFVSNVSHELRTPVTSIRGASETLKDGALNDPVDAIKFTDIIFRQSERLSRIIEDLLSLSKIEKESDLNTVDFAEQDIYSIILSALKNNEQRAHESGITLKLPQVQTVKLNANRTLIEQAVGNLIENAIEHSERGTTVTILIEVAVSTVAIVVTDQGCGIPEEHLPRVFERFYRVDKSRSRKFGGTGLGLAIVKHVALAHRGQVFVESKVNEGSTFKMIFPRQQKR